MNLQKSILLSGQPGSGKSVLAKKLSEIYGLPIYSIGKIFRIKYQEQMEKNNGLKMSFNEYWEKVPLSEQRLANIAALQMFEQEIMIGDFRYHENFKEIDYFGIFITADLNIRTQRLKQSRHPDLSEEQIKKDLEKRSSDEKRIGKFIFGSNYDYSDSSNYHLCINSGKLTLDQEVEIIKAGLENIKT